MEQLMTVKQAAKILGVSVDVMREMVWAKKIGYINLNKGGSNIQARFTKEHLEDFMRKCEVKAG